MFLESRATSARMSTPSMTSPTWLYCGFPEQEEKKCLCWSNVEHFGDQVLGKAGEKPERLRVTTVGPCSASTQLMTAEKNTWGTLVFPGEKKYLRFKFLHGILRVAQCAPRPVFSQNELKIDLGFTQSSILPTFNRRWAPKPNSCRIKWKGTRYEGERSDCSQAPGKKQEKPLVQDKLRLLLKRLAPTLPKWWIYKSHFHFLHRALNKRPAS